MNELGYKPCPKCGCTQVDYGYYKKGRYVYAERLGCRFEVKVPVYNDTWHNLRPGTALELTRKAWNEETE